MNFTFSAVKYKKAVLTQGEPRDALYISIRIEFLQRVSIACYAKRCISYRKPVRPSVCLCVCQTLALCQNDSSYDHGVFTEG